MAQHDYVIANGTGAAVRSDLNNALAAIVSQNSGATEPATIYAYQWWADTTTGLLKLRNGANNAWITLRELDGTLTIEDGTAGSPGLAFADDLNTGVFSPGADQVAFTAGGTARLTATTTGITSALPVDVPLGSASAPTVTFTGDLNTGIYSPGADQVGVATNGTGRLFVNSSGSVGIGTSAPNAILSVKPSASSTTGATTFTGDAIYIDCANTTNANGSYGGAISWSRAGISTTRQAAITNVQTGSDPDVQGLAFLTHSSASGTDPLIEAMRITGVGNVGIGTTAPDALLNTEGGSIRISGTRTAGSFVDIVPSNTGSDGVSISTSYYGSGSYGPLRFTVGGSERFRCDTSGRLLVGTSTARSYFSGGDVPGLQLEGTGTEGRELSVTASNSGVSGAVVLLGKQRSGTIGGNTVVQNNDQVGLISYQGSDGTKMLECARVEALIDGTPGANDMPGRLVFSVTSDGSASPTERVRIMQNGQFNTLDSGGNGIVSRSTIAANSSDGLFVGCSSATNTTNGNVQFVVRTNGNVVNTNNSYGAISDIKLKENIVDANSQWDDLKALQVRNYNFKEGQTHTQIGLVAQEVELVSPGLVSESPDRDEEGNDLGTVTKSVNYSVLYMKAVKALQEAMERIEQLEAKVSVLESKP